MNSKLFIFFIIIGCSVNAQGTWTQKADFGGTARWCAVGFSIESRGYIGMGYDLDSMRSDFWEYDPGLNAWLQKNNLVGSAREYAVCFVIGKKGYIGTGTNGFMQDFWEWDQTTNVWSQKANFGGTGRLDAFGFAIGPKGYIGTGRDADSLRSDFWEYDPSGNMWTQKANFGGGIRSAALGFSIGTKGYAGTGSDDTSDKQDFWEYDPSVDSWTQRANLGGVAREYSTGFSMGTKGYIGTGAFFNGITWVGINDFWEWEQSTNVWTQKANFGGTERMGAIGFSIGGKGYIGTGDNYITQNNMTRDFWEFTPDSTTSIPETSNDGAFSIYPNPFSIQTTLSFSTKIKKGTLFIYNFTGEEIDSLNFYDSKSIILKRKKLQVGKYFFKVVSEEKTFASGILLLE